MAGEVARGEEDVFLGADGGARWVNWETQPWLGSNRVVGGVMIMAEDVTEKVEAVVLRESELRMRMAQAAAQVGVWEWRLSDDHVEWSNGTPWTSYGLEAEHVEPSL